MIHGEIDSGSYQPRDHDNSLRYSSDIDYVVDQLLVRHKKKDVVSKSRKKLPWKRIIFALLTSFILLATIPYVLPPLYGDFGFDVSIDIDPNMVYLNDTMFVNVSIPYSYNITTVSADMADVESINLILVDNSSDLHLWSNSWFVHDIIPGEYIVTIGAMDIDNVSYYASVGLSVLAKEPQPVINESSEPGDNETLPKDIDNENITSNETITSFGLNLSLQSDKDVYTINETVLINGFITYNGSLINTSVDLLITSSNYNSSIKLDSLDGRFNYEFISDTTGIYVLNATVTYSNETVQSELVIDITNASIDNVSENESKLYIWDDSDNQIKYVADDVAFYANYYCVNGSIENATCLISFNIAGWTEPELMNYFEGYYIYSRIFNISGTFEFSINCSSPGFENITLVDIFVVSEFTKNVSTVSIVDPKVEENVYVVPGTSFYIERTISGLNDTRAVFAPLFSDSLTLERIEIIDNNSIKGEPKVKEILKSNYYKLGNGVSKSQKKLDKIWEKLIDKIGKLDSASLSDLNILDEPIKLRLWFKAPAWDDIIASNVHSSGKISYIVFSELGDDFDFEGSTWWNANWNYRKLIIVNSSLIDSDLTNFPILVNVTDSDLASDAQDDGDDIAFVLWNDNSTKLNHEIELFNGNTGQLVSWVNITNLNGSIDTKIWMYYGNSGCTSQQNPSEVWDSNYVAILHLNDTGLGTRYDSTINNNDGNPQNYDGDESTTNGRIAIADNFDGTNDRILINDSTSLSFTNNQLTIEGWVKLDTLPASEASILRKENQWAMQFYDTNTIRNLVATSGTTGWTAGNDQDYTFVTGTWYYWTFVYNGANIAHKLDAIQIGSTHTVTGNIVDNANSAYMAYCINSGRYIDGVIDEVRISKVARSSDWINASFNTVNRSQNFVIFGTEQQLNPIVSSPNPINGTTNVAIPPSSFNITISDPSADNMNITWRTNATGNWVTFNTTSSGSGVGNGTYSVTNTTWVTSQSTKYWWSVNVSNDNSWTNETYFFTTRYPPQLTNPIPANTSISAVTPICSVVVSDSNGGSAIVKFYENTSGSWILQQTNNNVDISSPKTVSWNKYNNASLYETRYWWMVNVTDDTGLNSEEIYNFNTTTNNPPILSNENPIDESIAISTILSTINITIADPDGNNMNWSIQTSPNIGSNSGNGASNSSISCSVSGLSAGITYYWYVNVTDEVLSVNETYNFTTSYAPVINLITPSPNGTTGVTTQPWCMVWANDSDGDSLNVTWATNASGSWINVYTNNSITANSTVGYQFTQFDNYSLIYYWKVYVNDSYTNSSTWFYFITSSITTSINSISPYNIDSSPYTISATGSSSLNNETLWYRYSSDNSTWNIPTAWWSNSWSYRKSHVINNAAGAGANYQVKIKVENSSGTDSGDTIYINNKTQNDFDDIRFIKYSDNITQLDYWIEEINPGINATFWVEIPDDINTSSSTIWIYYGNSSATNNSNGSNTFIFFDDFSSGLSKWNRRVTSGVYPQIENGYLRCGGGSTSSPYGHTVCDSDATYTGFQNESVDFKYFLASNTIMELGFRGIYATNQGYKARSDQRSGQGQSFLEPPYSGWGFTCGADGNRPSATTWYKGSIRVIGTSFSFYRNGDLVTTCSDSSYSAAGSISCQNHYGSYTDFDDVRVRKYVSPEPTQGSWSSEEQYLGGQGNNWSIWSNTSNPDTTYTWGWNFDFPNSTGYYEFYSIGKKSGSSDESAPTSADAICYYGYVDTSIDVNPSTWNIGIIRMGNVTNTSGFYFNLTNNGSATLDIQIKSTNATNITTGASWELNTTPDFDKFSLQYNRSDVGIWSNINLTYDTFITNLLVGNWKTFDLKLLMASTATKNDPLSVTITFRSVAH